MSHAPLTLLGGLSVAQFLADYWQKQPLLIRAAIPGYLCPVTPDELAGLACEEEVESRLVMERGGKSAWQLERGPFAEERFAELPATHWTLLVQEMNKHVPELALLQEQFNFLPNWRLDDVMVSYAPPHGSVGPHADNYDVFLLQGRGRRRWQINRTEPGADDLLPDLPLRIMRHFVAEQEWLLEPGDMLYLPPGVAHYGVSESDDCMTVSVGYRAPTLSDMLAGFIASVLAERDAERFFADPDLAPQAAPGEISLGSRQRIRAAIRDLPLDDASIDRWFGRYTTDVRPGHYLPEPEQPLTADQLRQQLQQVGEIWRSEYARFAFFDEPDGPRRLYAAGEEFLLDPPLAPLAALVSGQRLLPAAALLPWLESPAGAELLVELYNIGCLYFLAESEDE